ncbi:MAG: hypothetical protein FWC20_08745 [Oscillospiraceae bacterium]|nr:hypothetical protein [Oscillospiraceae bacterium]MCL2279476.1 hypothetical protein [Oscillospiraceae bacterium]
MERTMTAYTAGNAIDKESRLKEKIEAMINTIKAKVADFMTRLIKEETASNFSNNFNFERQLEEAKANLSNYSHLQILR